MKGVQISKPGYDVLTAEAINQYVQPDTPIFKVALTDSGVISFISSDTVKLVVIQHNLGYVPHFAVFAEVEPSSGFARLVNASQVSLLSDFVSVTAAITQTQLAIQMTKIGSTPDPTGDYDYLYQIYHDEAEQV